MRYLLIDRADAQDQTDPKPSGFISLWTTYIWDLVGDTPKLLSPYSRRIDPSVPIEGSDMGSEQEPSTQSEASTEEVSHWPNKDRPGFKSSCSPLPSSLTRDFCASLVSSENTKVMFPPPEVNEKCELD